MSCSSKPSHSTDDHLNIGMLALRVSGEDAEYRAGPITVIVSGVGRSGTSMIAKLLDALGLPMGNTDDLAVFEDGDLHRALFQFDYNLFRRLISEHDAANPRWGFKFASLQNHMFPAQLEYFRNPRLIIVMRDVIATASRSFISDIERKDFDEALINVTRQTSDMVDFIIKATCPTLVVSYEKFLTLPDQGIDAVAKFCGMAVPDEGRPRARRAIEPNNPEYIDLFHPDHRGSFDSVKDGFVLGWCASANSQSPVEVELLANGRVIAVSVADIYRTDLFDAGIGAGRHGFRFDLSDLELDDATVLEVRVVGSAQILEGSGRRLTDFPER